MDEKVLVTGAGGFIGSHLTERLVSDGYGVRVLVHYNSRSDWGQLERLPVQVLNEVEVFPGDIQDPFSVRKAVRGREVVYHLASLIAIPYSYVAPQSYVTTNVLGTLNVMQACLDEGVRRVVHTSTSEVYGTAAFVPIDESHPLRGQSPYSASKIGADKIAESYHLAFSLPVATIRPFNTYGPRQSARAVIPTIITQVRQGGPLKLGALHPTRDFTYVTDTVAAFVAMGRADDAVGQTVNVGSGLEISIGDLARKIMEIMGRDIELVRDNQRLRPPASEVDRLLAANAKAKALTGWEPRIGLDEGLARTVAWFEEFGNRYKSALYNL
jgi:NAD dependent epimerase/dehydratase